jgi:hypothetical protein
MGHYRREEVRLRYEGGVAQIRKGMVVLYGLHAELQEQEKHANLRASLLVLLQELDAALVRAAQPAPDPAEEEGDRDPGPPIAPHLEAGDETTAPEAGG